MGTVTTADGTTIFYKDWGPKDAQPIMFHHGWPLSADDWDTQMLYFLANGYRVIAHDRRGHGRSSQVGEGHDMDHYAADAAAVVAHLDLRNAIHVGHSTGGGEATHYVARHGAARYRVCCAHLRNDSLLIAGLLFVRALVFGGGGSGSEGAVRSPRSRCPPRRREGCRRRSTVGSDSTASTSWGANAFTKRRRGEARLDVTWPATPGAGRVVQQPYFGHAGPWKDYSQFSGSVHARKQKRRRPATRGGGRAFWRLSREPDLLTLAVAEERDRPNLRIAVGSSAPTLQGK